MKFKVLHIIFLVLLISSCQRGTNWGVSMDKNSTEPFGLYLAYDQLGAIFPMASKTTIYDLQKEIKKQNGKLYFSQKNNLIIAVTSRLSITKEETEELYSYVENGGNVLLLSQRFAKPFDTIFKFTVRDHNLNFRPIGKDSLTKTQLLWDGAWNNYEMDMPFSKSHFKKKEGTVIAKKMYKGNLKPVILEQYIGQGKLVIGLCPEMFTNYALLKDSNIHFYEQLLSRFKRQTNKVKWFSKFAVYPDRDSRSSNLWSLLKKKPYRYAFLVLLLMAALFFGFETRRKQRIVEVVPPVTNDSLAFTETIGKLYYGEKDNLNLAQKMIRYYLEHIRTTYGIPTVHLNQELAGKLARKLNKSPEESIKFINYLNQQLVAYSISESEIQELYKLLKKYS